MVGTTRRVRSLVSDSRSTCCAGVRARRCILALYFIASGAPATRTDLLSLAGRFPARPLLAARHPLFAHAHGRLQVDQRLRQHAKAADAVGEAGTGDGAHAGDRRGAWDTQAPPPAALLADLGGEVTF